MIEEMTDATTVEKIEETTAGTITEMIGDLERTVVQITAMTAVLVDHDRRRKNRRRLSNRDL